MLEPYQPAYTAPEAASPPRPAHQPPPYINIHSTSSLSLNEGFRRSSTPEWSAAQTHEASDNFDSRVEFSRCPFGGPTFVGTTQSMSLGVERSPSTFMMAPLTQQRRVRSAVDLVSLVMQEKLAQSSSNSFTATNV